MGMDELVAELREEGTVLQVTLRDLRDAVGADRLGTHVMQSIVRALSGHGLGYFPRDVLDNNPNPRQGQDIRIYQQGDNPAARVIEAVLNPSYGGDLYLNGLGDTAGNYAIIQKIRELVAEE